MALIATDKSYIGVDIGGSSIKLVELTDNKKRAQLVTYGYSETSLDTSRGDFIDFPEKASAILKKICKEAKTTTKQVIAALPVSSVFTSIISLSNIPKKDISSPKKLASAIQWEAKKVIPLPIEEMVLDWKIVTPKEEQEKEKEKIKSLQVLLTGAAKTLVKKYLDIFKLAGLNLISLETESFSLIRSLIGNDKSTIMIVDIGSSNTDISIIDEGIPFLNRSIDVAGSAFTKSISASLNISMEDAEQFKYDMSLFDSRKLPQAFQSNLTSIINEINYSLDIFRDQGPGKKVEKIILTGGSALLPKLALHFSETLNMKTYVGDPWARIIYPDELKPVLEKVGPRFSVSVGLAMRDIVE